eukprot:SAG11_NODE_617_length_8185_cov_6.989859_4_plen_112_part_00
MAPSVVLTSLIGAGWFVAVKRYTGEIRRVTFSWEEKRREDERLLDFIIGLHIIIIPAFCAHYHSRDAINSNICLRKCHAIACAPGGLLVPSWFAAVVPRLGSNTGDNHHHN